MSFHAWACAASLGLSRSAALCLLLLGMVVSSSAGMEDCVDYDDYLRWVDRIVVHGEDVEVAGDYAYVAGEGLWVFDVSNPAQPIHVGGTYVQGEGMRLAVAGDYAYLTCGRNCGSNPRNFKVIDVSDRNAPEIVGSVEVGYTDDVDVEGTYAYVAGGSSGLHVVDVADPAAPTIIGNFGLHAHDVDVVGAYAYVAGGSSLQVVDVADPASPVIVGSCSVSCVEVAVVGNYAYLAGPFRVVDISNPASPTIVSSIPQVFGSIAISGDYAYLASSTHLYVVDIADPNAPEWVGGMAIPTFAVAVATAGNYAYTVEPYGGAVSSPLPYLWVLDISNPRSPERIGGVETPGEPREVALAGDHACVVSGTSLLVANTTNPAAPVIVGSVTTPGDAWSVAVEGNHACVMTDSLLCVVDLSNPSDPTIIGSVDAGGGNVAVSGPNVAVSGNYAYVASDILRVVDISDPEAPTVVGGLELPAPFFPTDVAVAGDHAYVQGGAFDRVHSWGTLFAVNITDPSAPVIVGSVCTEYASTVTAAGHYAYVPTLGTGSSRLEIVDVSSPTLPAIVGSVEIPSATCGVAVSGGYAYLVGDFGLLVADVSDPVEPEVLGGTSLRLLSGFGVALTEDCAFVAGVGAGLAGYFAGLLVYPVQCDTVVPVQIGWSGINLSDHGVAIAWRMSHDSNHVGFHLYRAEAGGDRFERINDELIRSEGDGGRRYEFVDRAVVTGETYVYRLVAVDLFGGTQTFSLGSVTVGRVTPAAMVLHQNYPNPFNPSTSIAFELPEAAHVTLRIYDVSGSLVRTLVDDRLARNLHNVEWDGRDDHGREIGSGVYYCRLEAGARSMSRRMVMVH